MFEVLRNGQPTGLVYTGRNAHREATQTAKELDRLGDRRTRFYAAPVGNNYSG